MLSEKRKCSHSSYTVSASLILLFIMECQPPPRELWVSVVGEFYSIPKGCLGPVIFSSVPERAWLWFLSTGYVGLCVATGNCVVVYVLLVKVVSQFSVCLFKYWNYVPLHMRE